MSIKSAQSSAMGMRRLNASYVPPSPAKNTSINPYWTRPPAWPTTTVLSTEQKIVGLYAVYPGDGSGAGGNLISMLVSGSYTVNYGDGTTTNYVSNAQADYEINYNSATLNGSNAPVTLTDATDLVTRANHGYKNGMIVQFYNIVNTTGLNQAQQYYVINATTNTFQISEAINGFPVSLVTDGTATLLPYKIAVVTITPQAGQNLTYASFNVRNNASSLTAYTTGWLSLSISMPNATASGILFSGSTQNVKHQLIEECNLINLGALNTLTYFFNNCYLLQNVTIPNTNSVNNHTYMFQSCTSLRYLPYIRTNSASSMNAMFNQCYSLVELGGLDTSTGFLLQSMFSNCTSLRTAPYMNTATVYDMSYIFQNCRQLTNVPAYNVSYANNLAYMFNNCSSLSYIPFSKMTNVTNAQNMFQGCAGLITAPAFDAPNLTNASNMFNGCNALQTVGLFNFPLVSNWTSMFTGCASLKQVPLFNTANATSMSAMFQNCTSLEYVPLFNTVKVTDMSNMFSGCGALKAVPKFNTPALTNTGSMFQGCQALKTVPLFNTSLVTSVAIMFANCASLTNIPQFVFTAVTAATGFNNTFLNSTNLTRIQAANFRFTFSVASLKLSAAALNEIYTNLPTVTAQTITVANNYGTATDTPSIATAKGWTVTG